MPKQSTKAFQKVEDFPSFEVGSGNVFADVGITEPDTALAKADVARQIASEIRRRGLNQTEAAALIGIDQPRVSLLLRGRLSLFSLDRLMIYVAKLGHDVEVRITPASRPGMHIAKPARSPGERIGDPIAPASIEAYAQFGASSLVTDFAYAATPEAWIASKLTEERREVYEI